MQGTDDAVPIWYILDEFGSRIQHNTQPNIRMVPFCYIPTQVTFSIIWPTKNIGEGGKLDLSNKIILVFHCIV